MTCAHARRAALASLLAALLAQRMIKYDWHCQDMRRFDIIGTSLYAGSLFALIFGLSVIPDMAGGYLLAAAALLMLIFLRWELAVENPVVNVALFRHNTVFLFSNLAALINYSATFAVAYLLSLYLQYVKGLTARDAGNAQAGAAPGQLGRKCSECSCVAAIEKD